MRAKNRVVVFIGPVDICAQRRGIVVLKTRFWASYPHHGLPYFQVRQIGKMRGVVSVFGLSPKFCDNLGFPRNPTKELNHETYIPTLQNPPRPYPWLSGSHEDQRRPCRDQRSPRQRPQAPGCLSLPGSPVPDLQELPSSLGRLGRIRHRAQFDVVLTQRPFAKTMHFALHLAPTDAHEGKDGLFPGGGAWLGALLPKRWARRAVTRNTLRRQIYAVAAESSSLGSGAMVVRLHRAFDRKTFPSATSDALKQAVRTELQTLFAKVQHA